ncbi:MAG: RNA 3'-terminal phosphate cyclase [candidate division KSB1 bacterium]|nr:RNA 3'-terminal phosphate cyclase [candidate division KSB1 bacterium]
MILIDGAQGEGGGQILRTALALSVLTGRPFRMVNIRAKRPNPGLQAQHLKCVEAAAAISGARVEGAALRSSQIEFHPSGKRGGEYSFDIGTAGSALLVIHTIYLPLAAVRSPSTVRVTGGTHVPWSPNYHYLRFTWLPFLRRMGFCIDLHLARAGFFPVGGGRIVLSVEGASELRCLDLRERGELIRIFGVSAVARLPLHIAERQRNQALKHLEAIRCPEIQIEVTELEAASPGSTLVLAAEFENTVAAYASLGEKGKPAERVADEAASALVAFLASQATVDEFQADQLLLPLALAGGTSYFRTPKVTNHLRTNAEVLKLFLPVEIEIRGDVGSAGQVWVHSEAEIAQYVGG